MNPEIKAKWTAALRSGKYKQGRAVLRRKDNTFCCLGVLCDIYSKEKNVSWDQNGDRWDMYTAFAYLPLEVMKWAGLEGVLPRVDNGPTLAYLNDNGKSFEEIADLIEKGL